jgi:molybdopterin/thiamine biosynthesis adenylyltransferase
MNPRFKITRPLLEKALLDLERRHPFALERVGFFSCRSTAGPNGPILFAYDYHPVPDGQYLEDECCGARIGEIPIQAAMQRSLDMSSTQLWVHTHGRNWSTFPSPLDAREGPNVVRSLANLNQKLPHGWAVISNREISGQICLSKSELVDLGRMNVVGWPMSIGWCSVDNRGVDLESRHGRQGFLGPSAPWIIENAKIGIVGLGGGGSHINQQLAHLGFKHVVYAEFDHVTLSNLNRLVGATAKDVQDARLKTEIASRVFLSVQPDAHLDAVPARWEDKTDAFGECDVIFGCVDSFSGRRDLEQFCRSRMIPLIDIGMRVCQNEHAPPQIYGQCAVSMPGSHCLRCLNVITDQNLAEEAADYGAGAQPQVVWPNGILASTAVGFAMQMFTGWAGNTAPPARLDYKGFEQSVSPSNLVQALKGISCLHFGVEDLGDPITRRL